MLRPAVFLCWFVAFVACAAPTATSQRLSSVTASTSFNSGTPVPWGGYGALLWAKGPDVASGVNTSAPYCWTFGGSDTVIAHNQLVLLNNGASSLLTGSNTATTTATSTASDPGGRVVGGRFTYNNRLYLFGGSRLYDINDMWNYDGTSWTLVKGATPLQYGTKGVASSSNWPPSLVMFGNAFDERSNIWWVFAGGTTTANIVSSGLDQDTLWSYDVVSGQWTAHAGTFATTPVASPQYPAARRSAGLWIDANGDLWTYGGLNWGGTYFFDMWKYTVATSTWAVVSSISSTPVYGTQGQFAAGNTPGQREGFAYWSDPTHQLFFLFGGADNNWVTHFEDLWVFDTRGNLNQWAWIGGVQGTNNPDPSTYSNAGVLDRQWPMHRAEMGWDVDASGANVYIHGGQCVSLLVRDLYLITLSGLPGQTTTPATTTPLPTTTTPSPTTSSAPNATTGASTTTPLDTSPITTTPQVTTPSPTTSSPTTSQIASSTAPPPTSAPGCTGAPPLGATCVNGTWTVTGDITLNGPIVLDLGNRTVSVTGNVTIGKQAEVIVTDTGAIIAGGCVNVQGQITVLLNSTDQSSSSVPVITSNSSCLTVDSSLPPPKVTISTTARNYRCHDAVGQADGSDGKTFAVFIKVSDHCKKKLQWWAYAAMILGVVLMIGLITVFVVVFFRKYTTNSQRRLRSYMRTQLEYP